MAYGGNGHREGMPYRRWCGICDSSDISVLAPLGVCDDRGLTLGTQAPLLWDGDLLAGDAGQERASLPRHALHMLHQVTYFPA
jgi:hypothetical protein